MITNSQPVLSFVIPVRNDAAGLARCLRSIAAASRQVPVECIVIDNGSTDGSAAVAAAANAHVLSVPQGRIGELRNKGAQVARGSFLAFVDADHELAADWVTAAVDVLADTTVSAVGALCHPPSPATWVQRSYDGLRDHRSGRRVVEWLGSGNLVVRTDLFRRVGGFDACLAACEDVDLCRRIREAGGVIVSDARMHSVHYGDPVSIAALFGGELWRGRNNLQVSFRERPSLRGLPSILIPVGQLVILVLTLVAAASGYGWVAAAGVVAYALPSLARALRIRKRAAVSLHHAVAVAYTYDVARSLALILRTGHRRAVPSPVPLTQ